MVKRARILTLPRLEFRPQAIRSILAAALLAVLAIPNVHAKDLADYRVGDTVEADIVAPQKFIVEDTQPAATLKHPEVDRTPMIARYYPGVADESEAALRSAFANARTNFLSLAGTQFHHPLPDPNATDDFLQTVLAWPGLDRSFPVNTELAGVWARGQSDQKFLDMLVGHLRQAMQRYIFPAQAPEGWHTGNGVRLVALTNADLVPTPQLVDDKGFTVVRSNIISFTKARTDFRAGFSEDDHAWGTFAVDFLKENCAPDLKLTEAVRASRTAKIQMGDTYQVGQIVAKKGDVVTAKTLEAIKHVADIRASEVQPPPPPKAVIKNEPVAMVVNNGGQWVWFALGAVSLLALLALGMIWRLRKRTTLSLLPARLSSSGDMIGTGPAEPGSPDLQDAVAPHLARLMTSKLMRKLIAQRTDLIMMQEQVAMEIVELERRLEQVNAPLQERLQAYEKRIIELEQQLVDQTAQNCELIKAKIEGVKQQMETHRLKNQLKFN